MSQASPNTLTAKERADGWRLLFDGKTRPAGADTGNRRCLGWQAKDGAHIKIRRSSEIGGVEYRRVGLSRSAACPVLVVGAQ